MGQQEMQQQSTTTFRQQGNENQDAPVAPNTRRAAQSMNGATLWRPEFEHDACGTGFIAHVHGVRSHAIVSDALEILERLAHQEFLLGWVFENPEADFVAEAPVLQEVIRCDARQDLIETILESLSHGGGQGLSSRMASVAPSERELR